MPEDLRKDAAPGSPPQPGSSVSFTKKTAGTAMVPMLFPGPLYIVLQNRAAKLFVPLQSFAMVMKWLARVLVFNFMTLVALQQDQNYLAEKRRMLF